MESTLIVVLGVLVLVLAILLGVSLLRQGDQKKHSETLQVTITELKDQIQADVVQSREEFNKQFTANREELNKQLSRQLGASQEQLNKQLATDQQTRNKQMTDLQSKLTKLEQSEKTMTQLDQSVGGLRVILESPHKRGQWGERRLYDILDSYLIPELYETQYSVQLENGKVTFDCFLKLENPPGPIAIDSKFPGEHYEKIVGANSEEEQEAAGKELQKAVIASIKDIAKKYIIPGVTSDFALMFVPSEAILAYLHEKHPKVFKQCDDSRVYMTSPQTLIPALHAIRAVYERMEVVKQADEIAIAVKKIGEDANRLLTRTTKLERTLNTSLTDIQQVNTSAGKIQKDAAKLNQGNLLDENGSDVLQPIEDDSHVG